MSSEKNTLVRLATLKTPRDLSLGGGSSVTRGGAVRRKFTPNFNAAAAAAAVAKSNNQKLEASTVEIKTEKKNVKKDRLKKDGKDRKFKGDLYVHKRSVFDNMPLSYGKVKSSKIGSSNSSTSIRQTSSSSFRSPIVKVKSESRIDSDSNEEECTAEDDKEIIRKLTSFSLIDDDDDDDDDTELHPLSLPLLGNVKKDFEFDIKPNVKVKSEPMEYDKVLAANKESRDNNDQNKNNSDGIKEPLETKSSPKKKSERTYLFKKGEYYLVQLPNWLPGNPPMTEEEINNINNNKNNKNKNAEEPVKKKNSLLKEFSEGHIGKLKVGRDGEIRMLFGRVHFNCHQGPPTNCRQELGMMAAGSRKGPYESLYRFGEVKRSLVVHPDLRYQDTLDQLQGEEGTSDVTLEEYDVYLCKPQDKVLYLFNMPLRCGLAQIRMGRLKPLCGKVQFDLQEWPRGNEEEDGEFKPIMTSSGCNILPQVFAIGVFNEQQLHLTAVLDVVQMRPDFKSFKVGNEDKTLVKEDEEEVEDETAQLVNARMKVKETESAKSKRLASYQHLQSEEKREAWQELSFIDPTEHFRESSLISSSMQSSEFSMEWGDYLEVLTTDTKPSQNTEISLLNLHTFKLNEQVKWLVERCKAIDFQQLIMLLSPSAQPSEVIGYLEQFSVLIQGCWAVKSEHIISASNQAGVLLRALRDFVLCKFSMGEGVTRAELNSLHRLNDEQEAIVLEGISKQDSLSRQCLFILDEDKEFVRKHEEVVRRQELLMKQKFEQIKLILPFNSTNYRQSQSKRLT